MDRPVELKFMINRKCSIGPKILLTPPPWKIVEDDTLANAITYILLLRVKSFPKMYVTLCPLKWYHSPSLAHALVGEIVPCISRESDDCSGPVLFSFKKCIRVHLFQTAIAIMWLQAKILLGHVFEMWSCTSCDYLFWLPVSVCWTQ